MADRPGPRPPAALYVHVPFCVSVCPYCDFVVYGGRDARGPGARVASFVDALLVELDLRADALDAAFGPPGTGGTRRPSLDSVYLGGGTPSLLPAGDVGRLLERVSARYGIADAAEVTLEANPGPDDRGDLAGFRAAGVNRLSLGAQSMDPDELRRLGRRHTPGDVEATVRTARLAGIGRVSVDLLYDVPAQSVASFGQSIDRVLDLPIEHVSAYALTLDDPEAEGLAGPNGDHLPTRAGARAWRNRAAQGQDEDRAAEQYALADERLAAAGMTWYEVSNWALPGAESRHNLVHWRHAPYEAVGPGAHAFDGWRTRRWNAARLDGYLAALLPGAGASRLPPGGSEALGEDDLALERILLGLRLWVGIGRDLATGPAVAPVVAWAVAEGLAEATEAGRVRLTLRGRLLADELVLRLPNVPRPS